ncbi:MAG TPA: hypothetical protein VE130_16935 [Nitrososphaeraceae archaeon]|nr:hypothetical protein [Nitrososphaeraceae archaeon]
MFIAVTALIIVLLSSALKPPTVNSMITHRPSIYFTSFVSAHTINGSIGFNASGVIDEYSNYTTYPAFDYIQTINGLARTNDLTANSSFLPVPDLTSATRTPEASTAQEASEMTQSAIENMVNPSSLLSSAIDDIRKSGSNEADNSQDNQPADNMSTSFITNRFSTIPLYGAVIPPKDYLIVSSYNDGWNAKISATARIPCDGNHETPLKLVLLENWSSITYPPPKMHIVYDNPEGQLCMFRIEYPENSIIDLHVPPIPPADEDSIDGPVTSISLALYNSGTSELKLPAGSSITVSLSSASQVA